MVLQTNREKMPLGKRISFLGIFIALALICSYLESLIPFYFGIPGMKLGLTNVVIVFAFYYMGFWNAAFISVIRVVLSACMFGNFFSFLYSVAGAVFSILIMFLMFEIFHFKIITSSVAGGIAHNAGQLLVAAIIVENYNVLFYFPVLLAAGFVTGLLIGFLAQEVIIRVKRR